MSITHVVIPEKSMTIIRKQSLSYATVPGMKNINHFAWPLAANFPGNKPQSLYLNHGVLPTLQKPIHSPAAEYRIMDESWRMRMGTTGTKKQHNNLPPRRSTEDANRQNGALDPEDFDDVFGGPPRSVLSRQYSVEGDFARSTGLVFEDIFGKSKGYMDLGGRSDRTLPEFRIPESRTDGGRRRVEEEFYSDIFGNDRRSRSRSKSHTNSNSKSKSNSSSILSSEELSPFRPAVVDDDDVSISSFASKLRPINVAFKWNTSEKTQTTEEPPDRPCNCNSSARNHDIESDYTQKFKSHYSGFSQRVSSPEIISFGLNSYNSLKESIDDLQVNSPASVVSSFSQEQEDGKRIDPEDEDDEDDEVMSSYVIEINPSNRERVGEGVGIDEAIQWAKQTSQTRNLGKEWSQGESEEDECGKVEDSPVNEIPEVKTAGHSSRESPLLDKQKEWTKEDSLEKNMELELLDEDIKLWSDGKESNIRLLLSTLHHILWPSSGWNMIPLTNLKDSSSVKKAYQKARLCVHPDKLQQRGATVPQKYVADKAFPILQDAWATFISEDVRASVT